MKWSEIAVSVNSEIETSGRSSMDEASCQSSNSSNSKLNKSEVSARLLLSVSTTEAVAQAGDNFQVTALTSDPNRQLILENILVSERKDVLSYLLPGGATTAADNDTDTLDGNLPQANLYLPAPTVFL